MKIIDCPALYSRSKHYPYGDKVPVRVKALKDVTNDLIPGDEGVKNHINDIKRVCAGEKYPVYVNSHGAIAAVFANGEKLGLRQGEFQVVEWYCPTPSDTQLGRIKQYENSTDTPSRYIRSMASELLEHRQLRAVHFKFRDLLEALFHWDIDEFEKTGNYTIPEDLRTKYFEILAEIESPGLFNEEKKKGLRQEEVIHTLNEQEIQAKRCRVACRFIRAALNNKEMVKERSLALLTDLHKILAGNSDDLLDKYDE